MSWSISGKFGKAPAIRAAVAKEFEQGSKCMEPEETVRQYAALIMDAALAGQDASQVVEVSASGSITTKDGKATSHTLNIAVTPRWSFLE